MSISERTHARNDFERWLAREFTDIGAFTAFAILIEIGKTQVTPLCSTYFNVIGDEIDWSGITVLFAGAGRAWDGASFYPLTAPDGGPLDNPSARLRLHELEARIDDDPLVLNEGHFFDKWGRRLKVEEVMRQ